MKTIKINQLIKENKNDLQKLINGYIDGKYYFTQKQLDKIIKLRGERVYGK